MVELTSKQRKVLERHAQGLSALVQIGGAGVTAEQIQQVARLLGEHELVKVKFNEFKDEKRELSGAIAERTDSTLVRIIGNSATFYKPAKEAKDRAYEKELKTAG